MCFLFRGQETPRFQVEPVYLRLPAGSWQPNGRTFANRLL